MEVDCAVVLVGLVAAVVSAESVAVVFVGLVVAVV